MAAYGEVRGTWAANMHSTSGAGNTSRTSGLVHRLEYVWVRERGLLMRGSSFTDADVRDEWHKWLSGLQDITHGTGIRHPPTTRCYSVDGAYAAIINREWHNPDSSHSNWVSVLVGKMRDLPARLCLQLEPWPQPAHSPHHPYQPDEHGVWPLALPDLSLATRETDGSAASWAAHKIRIFSPVERLGELVLVEPLAAVLAGALEHLHRLLAWGRRFQLVFVGADEPTARGLLVALTDLLGTAVPSSNWPTFSTFEIEYPKADITDRYPDMVFMPHFQTPHSEVRRPTAYVFLAPALRPVTPQAYEFVTPAARGDGASERVARVLVAAYLEGGSARTAEALAGIHDLRARNLDQIDALDQWADKLEAWESGSELHRPHRLIPAPTPPPISSTDETYAGVGENHIFLSYAREDKAYVGRLLEYLRSRGLEVWSDEAIYFGTSFSRMIEKKIDACAAFVVVMSPAAQDSDWVKREVLHARENGKQIFPLLLSGRPLFEVVDLHHENVDGACMPSLRWVTDLLAAASHQVPEK